MTYETNKNYLASFIPKRDKVRRLYQRLSKLNTWLGVPASAPLTGMPTGSGGKRHDFGDIVAQRDQLQSQLKYLVDETIAIRAAIQAGLKGLPYNESLILSCHYLQGDSIPELIESITASETEIRKALDSGIRKIKLPVKGGTSHE